MRKWQVCINGHWTCRALADTAVQATQIALDAMRIMGRQEPVVAIDCKETDR